jgi:hypothetical protein
MAGSNVALANCPTPLTLPTASAANSVTFGDGVSYSLPILGLNVQSSPGQISSCIVPMTGSGGTQINQNVPGSDDAYQSPGGTKPDNSYFRTGDPTFTPDPGSSFGSFTGQTDHTWDIQISALESFLNGNDMVIYFNHNQTNSGSTIDQNLFIWAQIALVDTTGAHATQYFYITSVPNSTGLSNFGDPGGDPTAYTGPQTPATCTYPTASDAACSFPKGGIGTGTGSGDASFMVDAQGQVCLDGPVGVGQPVPCSGPHVATVNENLGANNVANAVVFPEINKILDSANNGGYNVIQADIRMGCNSATITGGVCPAGSVLNNGFEQIFIGQLTPTPGPPSGGAPEPATLALVGVGLFGAGFFRNRRRQA